MEITESDNTGAPSTSVNEVKAKGQQADLVLLEADLEFGCRSDRALVWILAIAPATCGAAMRDVLSD